MTFVTLISYHKAQGRAREAEDNKRKQWIYHQQ